MRLGPRFERLTKERIGFVVFVTLIGSLIWLGYSSTSQSANAPQKEATTVGNSGGDRQKNDNKHDCAYCAPPGNQEIYIPLIDLPEAEDGEMVFNSRSAHAMNVTPIFYERNGETVIGDRVEVQSGEIRYVNIKDLLPKRYHDKSDWGGFALSFSGLPREMWSQFRFLGVNGGSSVDEFFTVKSEARSETYEAAWWMPDISEAVVVLGNITDKATSASVSFGNGRARLVNLPPHATEILREERKREGPESVKIKVTGAAGSVIPAGLITAKDGSFNSVIRFYDPSAARQPNLFANGFRVRGVTPHMVLRNTTASSLAVLPKIMPLAGDSESFTLPQVLLGPAETTEVNLTPLILEARKIRDFDVVSIEIENYAVPGSLIGSLYGVNEQSGLNYDVPLRDSGLIRAMAGLYPWKITNDFRTVVYITNITDQETAFVAEATYDGGKFTLSPRKLKPGETAVFDLEKMRREQISDSAGNRLGRNASIGQFKWAVHGVTNGKITVIGRAEMVSRAEKISTSYSCHPDCGPVYQDDIAPGSCEISIDGSCTVTVSETAQFIDGQTIGPYAASADWSLEDQLATLSTSSGTSTMVTGSAAGSTNLHALLPYQQVYDWDGSQCIELYSYRPDLPATLTISTNILRLQYVSAEGNQDISNTLYVLKGTTVTFNALPNPSGANFPSNKPTWSGSSGISGNGQTKSVTFNTTSSSASDFKTVIATAGNAVTANVIVVELTGTLTPEDNFNGRSTVRFGVHERITLGFTMTPSGISAAQVGGIQWQQNSGDGNLPSAATDGTGTYIVADSAGSASLQLKMLDGPSKESGPSRSITVVEPSNGYETKSVGSGVKHFQFYWSCGFLGTIHVLPDDVSFLNLFFKEEEIGAAGMGWLIFLNGVGHSPGGSSRIGSGRITTGAEVFYDDQVWSSANGGPGFTSYGDGTASWAIPWKWSIDSSSWHPVRTATQTATSSSTGRCTIRKEGSATISTEASDLSSDW